MEKQTNEKKTLAERYFALNSTKRLLLVLTAVDVAILVILLPLGILWNPRWILGWALGSIVSIVTTFSLEKSGASILGSTKAGGTLLNSLSFFFRFLLWAIVLVFSALCTFRPDKIGGFDIFSFWTTMAAYFPGLILTILFHMPKKEKPAGDAKE